MPKSPDAFRTISEVSEWLETPAHVLRFWESKFTQVKPVKRAGGRRYYRPGDMELLGGIKKLLHEDGMTIKGVQKVLREQGVRYVAGLSPAVDGDEPAEDYIEDAPFTEVEETVGEVVAFRQPASEPEHHSEPERAPLDLDAEDEAPFLDMAEEADVADDQPEAPDEDLAASAAEAAFEPEPDPALTTQTDDTHTGTGDSLPEHMAEDTDDDALEPLPPLAPIEDMDESDSFDTPLDNEYAPDDAPVAEAFDGEEAQDMPAAAKIDPNQGVFAFDTPEAFAPGAEDDSVIDDHIDTHIDAQPDPVADLEPLDILAEPESEPEAAMAAQPDAEAPAEPLDDAAFDRSFDAGFAPQTDDALTGFGDAPEFEPESEPKSDPEPAPAAFDAPEPSPEPASAPAPKGLDLPDFSRPEEDGPSHVAAGLLAHAARAKHLSTDAAETVAAQLPALHARLTRLRSNAF